MKVRGSLFLLAVLLLVLLGAFALALLSERRIEGAVPGDAPLLGLAVTGEGFLVATGSGLVAGPDGVAWAPVSGLRGRSLVARSGDAALALVGTALLHTRDLRAFDPVADEALPATALAGLPDGSALLWDGGAGRVVRVSPDGSVAAVPLGEGSPREVVGLAAVPGDPPVLFAGGIVAGLWESPDGGRTWTRLLGTPVRAVLADPARPDRLLLGTPGGVLFSVNAGRTWEFTELRAGVEGLAARGAGEFYALTRDRLVYGSADGVTGWEALAAGD